MIRIYGQSDDLVEIEGIANGEHNNGKALELGADCAVIVLGDKAGGVCVTVDYHSARMIEGRPEGWGCWSVQVVQLSGDVPIPWPVTVRHHVRNGRVGYSAVVEIDAPADTPRLILSSFNGEPLHAYEDVPHA